MKLPEAIRKGCEISEPTVGQWTARCDDDGNILQVPRACALGAAWLATNDRPGYHCGANVLYDAFPVLDTKIRTGDGEYDTQTLLDWIIDRSDELVMAWRMSGEGKPDPRLKVADEIEEKLAKLEGMKG